MHNQENFLQEIVSSIAKNAHDWEASHNEHSEKDLADLQKMLGYRPSPKEPQLHEREAKAKQPAQKLKAKKPSLASQVDWRNVDKHNYVSSVKNQGLCGSCVGFGVTAAMESRARILQQLPEDSANAGTLPDLSAAQLFYCGVNEPMPCFRGWGIEEAMQFASSTGVVPDACFPYPSAPYTHSGCDVCDDWESQITRIQTYTPLDDKDEMKAWLAKKGPVVTAMTVYLDLFFYKSGVYTPQDALWNIKVGGHCVCVIGYDEDKDAWLAKNSWGPNWGDAGFFYIGYNQCGFDAQMWGIEDFQSIYQTAASDSTSLNQGGTNMKEANDKKSAGLTRKQIGLVQDAVGEMMQEPGELANALKDWETELKGLLVKVGASQEDLQAILAYFEAAQGDLDDEDHLGSW